MISFEFLNTIIIIGIMILAILVYKLNDIFQSLIALGALGGFLALEFIILKAPDVAMAEAAVGAILTPVIFIITLKKVSNSKEDNNIENDNAANNNTANESASNNNTTNESAQNNNIENEKEANLDEKV